MGNQSLALRPLAYGPAATHTRPYSTQDTQSGASNPVLYIAAGVSVRSPFGGIGLRLDVVQIPAGSHDAGVPVSVLNGDQIDAGAQQLRGAGMTQSVQGDLGDSPVQYRPLLISVVSLWRFRAGPVAFLNLRG